MSISSGIDSQFGMVGESTFATYATPTRFLEFTEESLKFEVERIESAGIKTGRRVNHRWDTGVQRVTGSTKHEVGPQGFGLMLKHAFGGVSTTGAGPYTHTFTPGALDALSATVQINRPDISGTDRVFSFLGMSITGFEFSAAVNEYLMANIDWYGADLTTAQSKASASYPSGYAPFVFTKGVISIGGSAYDVTEWSFKGDNKLKTDRHFIRSGGAVPKIALEGEGKREYTGSFSSDFIDLTEFNRFKNGTEAAMTAVFTNSSSAKLTFTLNVRYDEGGDPNIGGPEIPTQTIPFVATSSTNDATAVTVELINSDSTP